MNICIVKYLCVCMIGWVSVYNTISKFKNIHGRAFSKIFRQFANFSLFLFCLQFAFSLGEGVFYSYIVVIVLQHFLRNCHRERHLIT